MKFAFTIALSFLFTLQVMATVNPICPAHFNKKSNQYYKLRAQYANIANSYADIRDEVSDNVDLLEKIKSRYAAASGRSYLQSKAFRREQYKAHMSTKCPSGTQIFWQQTGLKSNARFIRFGGGTKQTVTCGKLGGTKLMPKYAKALIYEGNRVTVCSNFSKGNSAYTICSSLDLKRNRIVGKTVRSALLRRRSAHVGTMPKFMRQSQRQYVGRTYVGRKCLEQLDKRNRKEVTNNGRQAPASKVSVARDRKNPTGTSI